MDHDPSTAPRTAARRDGALSWIGLVARIILGGVLFVAGALKLGNLGESILAVRAYQLLPFELTDIVGIALPILEVVVGALLLTGTLTRLAGLVSALFMAAFVVAIASAWARGLTLDCGCFGGGGVISKEAALAAYPWEILRDVALGVLGVWLTARPRTPWAVDNLLFPRSDVSGPSSVDSADDDPVSPSQDG